MKTKINPNKIIRDLFKSQRLAVLATQDKGQPYTSLVAFNATADLKSLVFATRRDTRKYANLSANSRVAMLIDSRSRGSKVFKTAVAVTALGRVTEAAGSLYGQCKKSYLKKHPDLAGFVNDPSCALLCLRVDNYLVVDKFENVTSFKP